MTEHEFVLDGTAALVQSTRKMVLECKERRTLDREYLERTARIIDETRALIDETDRIIAQIRATGRLEPRR